MPREKRPTISIFPRTLPKIGAGGGYIALLGVPCTIFTPHAQRTYDASPLLP